MPLKANQIALIVVSALAIFLYWQKYEDVYKDTGRLEIVEKENSVILSWTSTVELPMTRRFEEAYANWAGKTKKFIINLDSRGGSLREGSQVIELIKKMKTTHLVETTVGEQANCLSMCVPIYLTGQQRSASRNSVWMFHEPRAYDFITDEEADEPESERRAASDRFFRKYFVNSEMDQQWRQQLAQEWVGRDVWRTGQQLVDEQSNIILKLY